MILPKSLHADILKRGQMYLNALKKECKQCDGDGVIVEKERHIAFDCPGCMTTFKKNKLYLNANIPVEYLNLEIAGVKEHYEDAYYKNYKKLYDNAEYVLGKTGVIFHRFDEEKSYGVSTAGVLLLKKYLVNGNSGFYCDINSFFNNLNTWTESEDMNLKRAEAVEYYKNVDILIVDNLGTEISKNYGENFFYKTFVAVLSERKNRNKANVICTDMAMDSFKKKYEGEIARTVDRNFIALKIHTKKDKHETNIVNDLAGSIGLDSYKYTGISTKTIHLKKNPNKTVPEDDDTLSKIR